MTVLLYAAGIRLGGSLVVVTFIVASCWLDKREAKRRAAEGREPDAEWLALLVDQATPIYDAIVCEQIEQAEGWKS